MFNRASTPTAQPPQGPGPLPILRRAVENEIVISPVDQYGRAAETAWVVDSVGMHWSKCHLLEDPTITRTFKHTDLTLTGRDSAGNEIKVPVREFHVPTGPQPRPAVTRQRSRVIDGHVQLVDVTERSGERSARGPDGRWRTESTHKGLKFTPPMSLNEGWRVEADPDKAKNVPPLQRLFRPGEGDEQGAIRIPRPVVDSHK
jgi:hypothetical protein